ncbi:lignin-forming anionic peroxidase [Vitis vinifera]|nr:lignin-forming anionic peroxidase [Vitis vinifera]|eukprot:XP_010654887.1 PREDICTED: lignin-forming anionic peroxidase [Vitis vinifera]
MGSAYPSSSRSPFISYACIFLAVFFILSNAPCEAQLSSKFYDNTCPKALSTIRTAIRTAVSRERRMAASLIRLHFHDCFVQGCDASILLDDSATIQSEKNAPNNNNSVRGFEVIDNVKSQVESICPGVVSCADILAVAARDSSVAVGGPTWTVKLGRRDSTTSGLSQAAANLPSFRDGLDKLVSLFSSKGLNTREMVALSGSHTIGQARCVTFRDRIHDNGTNIDAGFASTRRRRCPVDNGNGDDNLAPLDLVTPNSFDNNYFKNLIQRKGLLQSDQVLFNGGSTDSIVTEYSKSRSTFSSDFAAAMVKMGDIDPLTGSNGEIRKLCNAIN